MNKTPIVLRETYDSFLDRLNLLVEFAGNFNRLYIKVADSLEKSGERSLTKSGLIHYFKGKGKGQGPGYPSLPVSVALAEAGGVDLAWLATGYGTPRLVPFETRKVVLDTFHSYCRSHNLHGMRAMTQFVQAYNAGEVTRAAQLDKLTLVELDQWAQESNKPEWGQQAFIPIPLYNLDLLDDEAFTSKGRAEALKRATTAYTDVVLNQRQLDPARLMMVRIPTSEVAPAIKPGDTILCETRIQTPLRLGIYVLHDGKHYVLRKVDEAPAKKILLMWNDLESKNDREESKRASEVKLIARFIEICSHRPRLFH